MRWVTLREAQQILEIDEVKMEQVMNDPAFPSPAEIVDEYLVRLDHLEAFIIKRNEEYDTKQGNDA